MNITNVLRILCEAAEVNKIKASVGNKIPSSVMDALAKNAKETQRGRFFDNEAMAIINSLSSGNNDPYLLSNPNAVHAILKKMKKGNSSFKADEILNGGKGKEYWKNLYNKSKEGKQELTKAEKDYNTTGLKTAMVKSIDDEWFAILPKNFYDTESAEKELKKIDVEKSHRDLRKISAEIAAKDSGKDEGDGPVWGEDGKEKTNPKVNHWCVSSSGENYYDHYVHSGPFKFIIFVKKNPDGSPNWDERYLWYYGLKLEFADKWDRHFLEERILSKKALKFLESIKAGLNKANTKKKNFVQGIEKTATNKAYKDLNRVKKEYDISVDDEIESMLKGARRKNITRKKEVEIITKNMPWLKETANLKTASEIIKYLESKAADKSGTLFVFSTDNYKSGIAIIPGKWYSTANVLIFNGDEPLDSSIFRYYGSDLESLARKTNSVAYRSTTELKDYKKILNFLMTIVGIGNSKAEPKRLSGYRPDENDRSQFSTVHIKNIATPEKTIMRNLSQVGQQIFDRAYNKVLPSINQRRNSPGSTGKFFYNSQLRTFFKIVFQERESPKYNIYCRDPSQSWKLLTSIDSDNLDKAKKAIKEFQEKRLAELKVKEDTTLNKNRDGVK